MKETRSCEYNVQDAADAEGHVCGKKGVKRAVTQRLDMVYCTKHYESAKRALADYKAEVTDYGA